MESDRGSKANYRAGRVLSLSDIIYHSEGDNDASIGDPEREDSDYDDELELDFETSISTERGHDVDSNVLPRNLNLRIHRRGDSTMETERPNGSCGLPVLSCENDKVPYQVLMLIFTPKCDDFVLTSAVVYFCIRFFDEKNLFFSNLMS